MSLSNTQNGLRNLLLFRKIKERRKPKKNSKAKRNNVHDADIIHPALLCKFLINEDMDTCDTLNVIKRRPNPLRYTPRIKRPKSPEQSVQFSTLSEENRFSSQSSSLERETISIDVGPADQYPDSDDSFASINLFSPSLESPTILEDDNAPQAPTADSGADSDDSFVSIDLFEQSSHSPDMFVHGENMPQDPIKEYADKSTNT